MIELATEKKTAPITPRQREVVALIAAGCSNEEVGARLGISPRTAKAHCDVLRQKLGVPRRRQIPGDGWLVIDYDKLGTRSRTALAVQAVLVALRSGEQSIGEAAGTEDARTNNPTSARTSRDRRRARSSSPMRPARRRFSDADARQGAARGMRTIGETAVANWRNRDTLQDLLGLAGSATPRASLHRTATFHGETDIEVEPKN